MIRPRRLLILCLGTIIGLGGCKTVHEVTIDAISDRHRTLGASYHLEIADPTGGVDKALQEQAEKAIRDALGARGLFEVPAATKPDMIISASYQLGHGHMKIVTQRNTDILMDATLMPPPVNSKAVVVYDKTMELTAKAPGPDGKAGSELWSVRTKIVDTKQLLAPYLEALASACIDYIGENPGREVTLPIDSGYAKVLLQRRPEAPATN